MIEETIIQPETGETLYRDVRPIEYTYKGESMTVDQPGWYPADNDEDAILCRQDMKVAGEALKIMKARHQKFLKEQSCELGDFAFA